MGFLVFFLIFLVFFQVFQVFFPVFLVFFLVFLVFFLVFLVFFLVFLIFFPMFFLVFLEFFLIFFSNVFSGVFSVFGGSILERRPIMESGSRPLLLDTTFRISFMELRSITGSVGVVDCFFSGSVVDFGGLISIEFKNLAFKSNFRLGEEPAELLIVGAGGISGNSAKTKFGIREDIRWCDKNPELRSA